MLRRDPALWSRTPIRRSTRSALRSSRSFSESSPASARHKDEQGNNDRKKPEGMSEFERRRQQHLRRWRKRVEQDPYETLFGASEDMLKGRGLEGYIERQREMHRKGFEWVQKTFPKWMLEDMGLRDGSTGTGGEKQTVEGYPKKVKIDTHGNGEAKEREQKSPKPYHMNQGLEKDPGDKGTKSPSDSRWPREQPLTPFHTPGALREDIAQGLRKERQVPLESEAQEDASANAAHDNKAYNEFLQSSKLMPENDAEAANVDRLVKGVLTGNKPEALPTAKSGDNQDWRQTALDRRAPKKPIPEARRKTEVSVIDVTAKDKARNRNNTEVHQDVRLPAKSSKTPGATAQKAVIDFNGLAGSRVGRKEVEEFESRVEETGQEVTQEPGFTNAPEVSENTPKSRFSPYTRINTDDWVLPPKKGETEELDKFSDIKLSSSDMDIKFDSNDAVASSNPRKPTSEILKQLPQDDIDFLTADDVRASMGRTKGNHDNKAIIRQKLEEEFVKGTPEIDSMLEAQVVNGQFIRRKTREMAPAQEQIQPTATEPKKITSEQKADDTDSKPVSVLETGIDFMSRWLHNGGNAFAQHFWQDPVPLVADQLSNADEQFLKGINIGVLKGRKAFATIKDELVEDIPATQELVNRLNRDEIKASAGAVRLYRDLPSALKDTSAADAAKAAAHKRAGKLRQELLDTDKQYKKACEAVDGMKNEWKPTFLQRKRLRYASEVLGKNAKLTRMAVFGLQRHIEVEAGTSGGLVARELLHRLLTLQDTQLALSRLVSRAMRVLGVKSEAEEEVLTKSLESNVDLSDPSVVEALAYAAAKEAPAKQTIDTAAANARLEDEVSQQKAAMHGLSDDGYKHPPKPFVRKAFEGPNPLAHSLFRPFGLQLDSLGKDADAAESEAVIAAKKEKSDRALVKEVKKAYEDTYGPITVDHTQVPSAKVPTPAAEVVAEVPKSEPAQQQPSIQLLKEDEVSPTIAVKPWTDTIPWTFAHENATRNISEAERLATWRSTRAENLQPSGTSDTQSTTQGSPGSLQTIPTEHQTPMADISTNDSLVPGFEYSYDPTTETHVPITYKSLIYNASTDKLSITTSQVPQPNPPITPIPLHQALATLSHPAKFVDHLPESFFVLQVKTDVLSLRTASPFNATSEKSTTSIAHGASVEQKRDGEEVEGWKGINPVDGTTTLSPTGFVGVGSELDRDFAERRRQADEYHREAHKFKSDEEASKRKKRGRVGVGGVVKTAIWAGAFCYVVGVAAEVVKGPF